MRNYAYSYPFLPLSGQVIDGASSDLLFRDLTDKAGSISVGIYDADTQAIATGSGNGTKFFIGYSSEHTKDFLDKYLFGAKTARGNTGWSFKGNDVLSFEYSDPTYLNNERWVLGWSGSDGCNEPLPKFLCGKPIGVKVRVYGAEISKRWNGDFVREYYSDVIPCTNADCVNGVCPPEYVNPVRLLTSIASKVNNDYETKQINLKARVISAGYTPTVANMHTYQLVVTDDGSNHALGQVQNTVPKPFEVSRVNRVGLVSIYEVCALSTPAAFQPEPQAYFTTDCDGCNQVLSNATYYDVYTVTATAANATDIDTEGERTTVINNKVTGYTGASTGTYVSHNGTQLVFTMRKAKGAVAPTPANGDVIVKTGEAFTLAMPATIAWTEKCDAYRVTRNLCITLRRKECTGVDRLDELQDFYASYPNVNAAGITKTAGTDCEDTYQVTQYSIGCMTDSCLAADTATFEDLGAYEDSAWTVVEPAPDAWDPEDADAFKAGLEFSIAFPKDIVPEDEFDPWSDNTDQDPIRMEVSFVYDPFHDLPTFDQIPIGKRVSRISKIRQSGLAILQEYIKSNVYHVFGADYYKPRMRRVLDSNLRAQVERTSPYRLYYLKVKINRNNTNIDQKAEIAEITFAVPLTRPDKMQKLEAAILSPLTKFGVSLQPRVTIA